MNIEEEVRKVNEFKINLPDSHSPVHQVHNEGNFNVTSIIERLSRMHSTLSTGKLTNQVKLTQEMGDEFAAFKKYHQQLQATKRIEIEKNE